MNQYQFHDPNPYQGKTLSDTDSDSESVSETSEDDTEVSPTKNQIGTKVTLLLLTLKNQIKINHWQTNRYSEHTALDNLFAKLTKKNDEWVEVFQGKYGRIDLASGTANLTIHNLATQPTGAYLTQAITKLLSYRDSYFNTSPDSDLSNIFDEIIGHLNRAKYLLSLH